MTGVVDIITTTFLATVANPYLVVMSISFIVLLLGMILDPISIMYLLAPILVTILQSLELDPIWFGVSFVCALAIGQAAPPVGVNLFTVSGLVGTDLDSIAR